MATRQRDACPICGLLAQVSTEFGIEEKCDCPRCGTFRIAIDVADDFRDFPPVVGSVALVSYFCRRAQRANQQPLDDRTFVASSVKEKLPNPAERLDNLLLY